jgi:hypothetical protein
MTWLLSARFLILAALLALAIVLAWVAAADYN